MKWKSVTNFITLLILSIAYTIVTFLIIIGPLHTNYTGDINSLSAITVYGFIYWAAALIVSWTVYFILRKHPETLFFTLVILGVAIIIAEIFMWGAVGP